MKKCETCDYAFDHHRSMPCRDCYDKADKPHYKVSNAIASLIEAAERKAFQAGWEGAIDTYEAGDVREYLHEDFEKWKEESK